MNYSVSEALERAFEATVEVAKEETLPEALKTRKRYEKSAALTLTKKYSIPEEDAKLIVQERCKGQLKPDDIITFHRGDTVTVAEASSNPLLYDKQPCADPVEPAEGTTRAMFFANTDTGNPIIHSKLHGGQNYFMNNLPIAGFGKIKQKNNDRSINLQSIVFGLDPDAKTAGDVIKELSDAKARGETFSAEAWFPILYKANLSPSGEDEVLDYLASQGVGRKRSLFKELQQRTRLAEAEDAWDDLKDLAGKRKLVKHIPHNLNKTTELTERGVMDVRGKWPYFDYGGIIAYSAYEIPTRKVSGVGDKHPPKIPVIKPYSKDSLHLRVEQSVLHYEEKEKDDIKTPYPIPTPLTVVNKLLDNPSTAAPKVAGLVSHPVVDLNGRVINNEWVDGTTGLLLQFGGASFQEPESVTKLESEKIVDYIHDTLFSEFEYRLDTSCPNLYKIAAISLLLTGILRKIVDQAPGFLTVANMQGTGKTTLNRIVHVILTGRDMPVSSMGGTSEEMQKAMLATMLESPAMVCFDNILDGSEVRDQVIAKIITSPYFKGRILGKSQEATVPTNCVLALTGNNISLSTDLVRRFVPIHLTAQNSAPETRCFKHPDIVQHCLNHRANIIRGSLSLVKSYIDSGSPLDNEFRKSSGFHQWDKMVRFPLLWAVGVDVLEAIEINREQSTEHSAMEGLMACLYEIYHSNPFSSTELLKMLDGSVVCPSNETRDHMRECVLNLSQKAVESTRSLSWVLKKLQGRNIQGKELKYRANSHGNLGKFHINKSNN